MRLRNSWKKIKTTICFNFLSLKEKMRIASLNLGYNVMANKVEGSEALFVEICQTKYGGGWNDKYHISECSKKAAEFISSYDLFGLQEMNKSCQREFENYLSSFRNYIFETSYYLKNSGVTIGYDPKKMGKGVVFTPKRFVFGHPTIGRGMIGIWFPNKKLVFINLHAPHDINIKKEIEKAGKEIERYFSERIGSSKKIDRILMVGDFNDGESALLMKNISILGKNISLPQTFIPQTCCVSDGYKYFGDYILDSSVKDVYFGIPPGYNRYMDAFSDHDPVVMIEY